MTGRTLSSAQAFWLKYLLTGGQAAVFLVAAADLLFFAGRLVIGLDSPPPWEMRFSFILIGLFGLLFFYWAYGRLKEVRLGEGHLYVSNYFREIAVPLSEVRFRD